MFNFDHVSGLDGPSFPRSPEQQQDQYRNDSRKRNGQRTLSGFLKIVSDPKEICQVIGKEISEQNYMVAENGQKAVFH